MRRWLAFALPLLLAACKFPETPAPPAATLTAPTEAEARKYAEQFVEALTKPNIARASMMIDWDILLQRATSGSEGSSKFRDDFIRGAKATTQLSSYATQMANLVRDGAKISLLRVRGDDHERRALLRVLLPKGGVTYNEMLLTRDDKGYVRAADVYTYASGEYFSALMRRMYLTALASEPTVIERLAGKENTSLEAIRMYKELSEKTAAGKSKEAVELFKRMSPAMRKEKMILVIYVSASANLDEAQYQSAIDELRRNYPNDGGLDLMLIDGFYLRKRYDEALAAVDRLDHSLGGDPYLDTLRANMLVEKGDLDAASAYAAHAVEQEASLAAAHWAVVTVSLARKDFDGTARELLYLRDVLGVELADLTTVPAYAQFVRSRAYRRLAR